MCANDIILLLMIHRGMEGDDLELMIEEVKWASNSFENLKSHGLVDSPLGVSDRGEIYIASLRTQALPY